MFHQSKIIVWYKIASQKIILGEVLVNQSQDMTSLWRRAPSEDPLKLGYGYQLSLFDDDGREVANKSVSVTTADRLLFGTNKPECRSGLLK
ncbi:MULTISPECIES: 30S ribosomal protein S6 modification protein [Vibrio]|uniref:30S ribosomal protein S6 modification protein n=1 Tax=Vibrio TaxID=662 RepID=UPI000C16EC27|nr:MULTISPECIES: 30S ribosomal protein S6 modification protein [Vibrio]NAW68604.1 30S ribosomal protein S6 modification protein [Vibrio sp. V28_P6S34P95]NAX04506.1 30S ribosomal protein S6 modification protein [Vibrio sp. V30_P3S12P165]NAX33030.1 30S ribosomal protein S6 modification protein [Vibrio sp. V29_P1S30P107]NAX36759.1 30S ribosomal protein S6 modification protein [Vibrio sp. V27_P1S3P104]NNN45124.1 30S ribosomal protein S6 modification protein [Vibrio sp. 1-1(7)]